MSEFRFLDAEDYLALPHDPDSWVIQDLIPVGGLCNIFGQPKAGKTFVAMGMAQAIASGAPSYLGFEVLVHGPSAILQLDTPRGMWADRIREMRDKAHLPVKGVKVCDQLMLPSYPFNALDPEQIASLRKALDEIKPVVVFIDTLREAHGANENDSTDMRNVLTQLMAACRPAAIVLLSHARKNNMFTAQAGDDIMSDNRGSNYVAGKMDVVIRMTAGTHKGTTDLCAQGFQYQGRGRGKGKLEVNQDTETGLVVLDGPSQAYWGLIHQTTDDNPSMSVAAIAKLVEAQTSYRTFRTIQKDVTLYRKSAMPRLKAA